MVSILHIGEALVNALVRVSDNTLEVTRRNFPSDTNCARNKYRSGSFFLVVLSD